MSFEPATDRIVGGKYRLLRRLAAGGMGSVWSARHEKLDADVAIKFMTNKIAATPSGAARFEREAKATAQLASPHVVRVQDFGLEGETAFMVLELLVGEDLAERLDRVGVLDLEATTIVATSLCKALSVAHDAGLVHRDIKPRNVFLARQGDEEIVKLLDFGVARETVNRLVDDVTTTGLVLGSPSHMSPEQAASGEVDARSDLWSLGIVLYRCLVGRLPFDGANVAALVLAIVSAPLVPPSTLVPTLGADVDRFFARALSRNPAHRFQSAREMGRAFAELSGKPGGAKATTIATGPVERVAQRGRDEPTVSNLGGVSAQDLGGVDLAVDVATGSSPSTRRFRIGAAALLAVLALGSLLAIGWRRINAGESGPPQQAPSTTPATTAARGSADPDVAGPDVVAPDVAVDPAPSAVAPTTAVTSTTPLALGSQAAPPSRSAAPKKVAPVNTACAHFDSFTGHCLP